MEYYADLHVHSPFSRATSKDCSPAGLAAWAAIKGLQVIGTGDFSHPAWRSCLKESLLEAEPGFYRLRQNIVPSPLPTQQTSAVSTRFVLSAEISCIYKRHGKVRKVHNLVYVPDFAAADRIAARLARMGNIISDGRPILGLDSRDLLEIVLEEAPDGFLVPAHIWTPWFSLFGARSGFDTIEECFGDLAPYVFALETGLSSDPPMNRLISGLDRFTLMSNSDCHSPARLGREANMFATGFDFHSLRNAVKDNDSTTFRGTIEFYPEEGKYHLDGHRACRVRLRPAETRANTGRCPACGKPVTVGVLHRVMELADRQEPFSPLNAPTFHSLVPLAELIGEVLGTGPASKTVWHLFGQLINRFGSELAVLLQVPVEEISTVSPLLAEAVRRARAGNVLREAGYDGQFGTVRAFPPGEREALGQQWGDYRAGQRGAGKRP